MRHLRASRYGLRIVLDDSSRGVTFRPSIVALTIAMSERLSSNARCGAVRVTDVSEVTSMQAARRHRALLNAEMQIGSLAGED
jgi:hypothetical protein